MPQHEKLDLRASPVIKNEEILKQNLQSMHTVVMSLCDAIREHKVACHK